MKWTRTEAFHEERPFPQAMTSLLFNPNFHYVFFILLYVSMFPVGATRYTYMCVSLWERQLKMSQLFSGRAVLGWDTSWQAHRRATRERRAQRMG